MVRGNGDVKKDILTRKSAALFSIHMRVLSLMSVRTVLLVVFFLALGVGCFSGLREFSTVCYDVFFSALGTVFSSWKVQLCCCTSYVCLTPGTDDLCDLYDLFPLDDLDLSWQTHVARWDPYDLRDPANVSWAGSDI